MQDDLLNELSDLAAKPVLKEVDYDLSIEALPRRDTREAAFRRFEYYIERATIASYVADPAEIRIRGGGMSAGTFIARFNDALLGYKRYHYSSSSIPDNFDFTCIKLFELEDGKVFIRNVRFEDEKRAKLNVRLHASNREAVLAAVRTYCSILPRPELPVMAYFDTPTELDWLVSLNGQELIPNQTIQCSTARTRDGYVIIRALHRE